MVGSRVSLLKNRVCSGRSIATSCQMLSNSNVPVGHLNMCKLFRGRSPDSERFQTKKSKNSEETRQGEQLTLSISSASMSLVEEPEHFESIGEPEVECPKEEEWKESEERQAACGNVPEKKPEVVPNKDEVKMEQEMILNETNPHFAYLLNSDRNSDPAEIAAHARVALEQTAAFQWTMKKRLSFDEGCWKHLSRRISSIRAEVTVRWSTITKIVDSRVSRWEWTRGRQGRTRRTPTARPPSTEFSWSGRPWNRRGGSPENDSELAQLLQTENKSVLCIPSCLP